MSKLFTTVLPSLVAGGLLFGSALTDAQPSPPPPPAPPTANATKPPKPPKPPRVDIDIDLGGIDQLVEAQIKQALEAVKNDPKVPPEVRDAVTKRLEKVRIKLKNKLAKVRPGDIATLGTQLGQLGEVIEEEMERFGEEMEAWGERFGERFGKDMEKWGEQFGKDMEKWGEQFGKDMERWGKQFKRQIKVKRWDQAWGPYDDDDDLDDDFDESLPDVSAYDADRGDDLAGSLKDLGNLGLSSQQRAALKRLRSESDARVARAKADLERASEALRRLLEEPEASELLVSQAIDQVAKLEAEIRKARILAWVNARKLLDDAQRKKVEAAARGRSR